METSKKKYLNIIENLAKQGAQEHKKYIKIQFIIIWKEDKSSMIIPMTIEYALQISGWTYEDEYSIYSFTQNKDTINELMNGEYYAYFDLNNNLSGYFCFGKSAQIPTIEEDIYYPDMLDIGLGQKPMLCGKGQGDFFVKNGLEFAQDNFNFRQIRLTVAEFNTRAIHVYEKMGFHFLSSVTHRKTGRKFWIMTYEY